VNLKAYWNRKDQKTIEKTLTTTVRKTRRKALEKMRSDWKGASDGFYPAVNVLFGKHNGILYK
jgi:hypothetical protein